MPLKSAWASAGWLDTIISNSSSGTRRYISCPLEVNAETRSLSLVFEPGQLRVGAFGHDREVALDGLAVDEDVRIARLTEAQRMELVQPVVIVRIGKEE